MSSTRYLVISDDPAVHDLVPRRLTADGAEVETTQSLEDAYERLADRAFAAVLLDLTPALVGHLLLLASRTIQNEYTPFVVLLGAGDLPRHWAEEFKAERILEKLHTDLAEVVRTLKEAAGEEVASEA
jgi:DNA-binding NtrC family response regulator